MPEYEAFQTPLVHTSDTMSAKCGFRYYRILLEVPFWKNWNRPFVCWIFPWGVRVQMSRFVYQKRDVLDEAAQCLTYIWNKWKLSFFNNHTCLQGEKWMELNKYLSDRNELLSCINAAWNLFSPFPGRLPSCSLSGGCGAGRKMQFSASWRLPQVG